jgi:hypothetical protein
MKFKKRRARVGSKELGTLLTHCRETVGKLSRWIATVDSKAAIHGPRCLNSWPLNGAILLILPY